MYQALARRLRRTIQLITNTRQQPMAGEKHGREGEQQGPDKRAKGSADTVTAAFLQEPDVGITQFITPGWKGFDAIIKHRYADFFVNEIDTAGRVVHLTSYTDVDDPEPPKTEEEKQIEALNVPEDPQEAFSQAFERLEPILGAADAQRIKSHLETTDEQTLEERTLSLDCDLDKDQRRGVYLITNNFLPTQVTCETVDGKLRFIRRALKSNGRPEKQQQRRFARGARWRHVGDYCSFVMQKENHDTMDILNQMARLLRVKSGAFSVAGTKDKRAITVQRCTAFRIDHTRLINLSKKLRGARLGNFGYSSEQLGLGDLGGNQFQIVLRFVTGADAESLAPVLEGIRSTGFINYFGMQRFGTRGTPSHVIGIAVLKAQWQDVVSLVLKPPADDTSDAARAREMWSETRDAKAVLDLLPHKGLLAERCILQKFVSSGSTTDAAGAFATVPRNLRLMYVHAYQSFIWNSAVSERIRLFGTGGAVPGDLVIVADPFSEKAHAASEAPDGPSGAAETEPVLVTPENAGSFTIYDVVLPLPGWKVKYPENEVKEVYTRLMEKDEVSLSTLRDHPMKEYRLSGAYRHLVIKPRDFSCEWMRFTDDKLPLARSDSDEIEGKHAPESIDFGEHQALKLKFDLPSSTYATMLLRELMRQETASAHQQSLSSKNESANTD
ncbi:multisubstrate pseudouridine synthase 7 [Coemansia sp. RSA 552]|nr:multisubstrate pseudouridine synthase 7 [Coemansia sp. RSA 552]